MIAILLALAVAAAPTGCAPAREGGRIVRSGAAVRAFRATHPCPATGRIRGACPGYVIDHLWPLCAGGCDVPENMAWQEVEASRRKDQLERRACLRPGEQGP